MDPKANQQIRSEANQLPADKKQKQTVGNDDTEHRCGEERQVREETAKILVPRHVANAENKDAESNQGDHHEHDRSKRVEHPPDAKRLFAKTEPHEVVEHVRAVRMQCRAEKVQ